MRIVADTNVIVSAFLWGGTRGASWTRSKLSTFNCSRAMRSSPNWKMYSRASSSARSSGKPVLLPLSCSLVTPQLATLIALAEVTVPDLRDPDDAHILACALAARAEAIVTGDDDLRVLGNYRSIPIFSPADCLSRLAT